MDLFPFFKAESCKKCFSTELQPAFLAPYFWFISVKSFWNVLSENNVFDSPQCQSCTQTWFFCEDMTYSEMTFFTVRQISLKGASSAHMLTIPPPARLLEKLQPNCLSGEVFPSRSDRKSPQTSTPPVSTATQTSLFQFFTSSCLFTISLCINSLPWGKVLYFTLLLLLLLF